MTGEKTTLGAWLDPMADKLLLVTMFVMLTLPEIGQPNRLPLWFTVLVISRDVAIVATVAVVNLAIGPRTFRPSIYGKIATALYIVTGVAALYFNYLGRAVNPRPCPHLRLAGHHRSSRPGDYADQGRPDGALDRTVGGRRQRLATGPQLEVAINALKGLFLPASPQYRIRPRRSCMLDAFKRRAEPRSSSPTSCRR